MQKYQCADYNIVVYAPLGGREASGAFYHW